MTTSSDNVWFSAEGALFGPGRIDEVHSSQQFDLGTVIKAKHATRGVGEFIYLKGVASTVAGSIVIYDDTHQTALATSAVGGPSRAVAVAMAATVADKYGWYQISGMATAVKDAAVSFADGAGLGVTAGAAVAVATGNALQAAITRAVASAKSDVTSVAIAINRPHTPMDVS